MYAADDLIAQLRTQCIASAAQILRIFGQVIAIAFQRTVAPAQTRTGLDAADLATDRERRRNRGKIEIVVNRLQIGLAAAPRCAQKQAKIAGNGEMRAVAVPVQRQRTVMIGKSRHRIAMRIPNHLRESSAPATLHDMRRIGLAGAGRQIALDQVGQCQPAAAVIQLLRKHRAAQGKRRRAWRVIDHLHARHAA